MERRFSIVAFAVMAVAAVVQTSKAETHDVGGVMGWTVPASGGAYQTWAMKKTFAAGDSLEFNFTTGTHDVAEVTKAAFDTCNIAEPISLETKGPADMDLKKTGMHYFICTIGRHCALGQKLAVNVTDDSSTPNTPSSSSPNTTHPSPNSAPSLAVPALSATFLSLATAAFF